MVTQCLSVKMNKVLMERRYRDCEVLMLQPSSMLPVWVILSSLRAAAAAGDIGATTPSIHSSSENTNAKTLDIVKEELQKNNDDYKDKSPDGESVKSAAQSLPSRRALSAEPQAEPAPTMPKKYSSVAAARNPKYVNKNPVTGDRNKVDKLRSFLDKYKVIVNEFMANRNESTPAAPRQQHAPVGAALQPGAAREPPQGSSAAIESPPAAPRRQQAPVGAALRAEAARELPQGSNAAVESPPAAQRRQQAPVGATLRAGLAHEPPQGSSASDEGPVPRAKDAPVGLDHLPPSAAQLDMSPARGGRVEILRNKNRLCHRHVMIPEGPKYDSQGKVYLAQYTRVRDREYAQTRKPRILLPKCCNCCRKSVLGCE